MAFYIILSIFIIILLLLSYTLNHYDFMAPSFVFCAMFTITSVLSCYVAYTSGVESFSGITLFVLISGVFVFCIGDWLVQPKRKKYIYENLKTIDISIVKIVLFIAFNFFILTWMNSEIIRIVRTNGYFGSGIMTYYRFLTSYNISDDSINGLLNQLTKLSSTSALIFGLVFINNKIIIKNKGIKDYIMLIPIIQSLYLSMLSGGRAGTIGYITSIVFVGLTLNSINHYWNHEGYYELVFKIMLIFIGAVVTFYFASGIVGRSNVIGNTNIFDYFAGYFGKSIYNFDCYIVNPPAANTYFGQETLSGIYTALRKFGLSDVHYIIHLEFRTLPDGSGAGNVYTFFRRLIQDYGFLGMYFLTFIISISFALYYKKKIVNNKFDRNMILKMLGFSYFYRMIFIASFDQTIFVYLSIGTIIYFFVLYFVYVFLVELHFRRGKIKWKKL